MRKGRVYFCRMEIIIDNGHGIDTRGKCSPDGLIYEWHYTRRLARAIAGKLADNKIVSHLLVPEERDIPLSERIRRADRIHSQQSDCLLLSLHINAAACSGWHNARGFCAFISPGASPTAELFASEIMRRASVLPGNRVLPTEGFLEYPYAILSRSSCPAVLTEHMFMDNRRDVAFLLSEQGFDALLDIHVGAAMAMQA